MVSGATVPSSPVVQASLPPQAVPIPTPFLAFLVRWLLPPVRHISRHGHTKVREIIKPDWLALELGTTPVTDSPGHLRTSEQRLCHLAFCPSCHAVPTPGCHMSTPFRHSAGAPPALSPFFSSGLKTSPPFLPRVAMGCDFSHPRNFRADQSFAPSALLHRSS